MQPVIPLDKMTTLEKLRAIEEIWADLLRTPGEIPTPKWHKSVLEEREKKVRDGTAKFLDWADVKRRIRRRTTRRT